MRRAYLSVRCVAKGVSPFHKDLVPSSLMICFPQSTIPAARSSLLTPCKLPSAYRIQLTSPQDMTPCKLPSAYKVQLTSPQDIISSCQKTILLALYGWQVRTPRDMLPRLLEYHLCTALLCQAVAWS